MKKVIFGFMAMFAVILFSCSKDNGKAVLQVRLVDAPADFDKVLIDIQGVQIHASGNENEGSWQSLDIKKGVYNLLDFRNGMDTLLGSIELPAGTVSEMRLILGPENKLVKGDWSSDMDTPSAQQSGLKFNIHAQLEEGVTYRLWIDFDAARSIVSKGNGSYSLKPVVRQFTEATSGAIKGFVNPVNVPSNVYAIANGDTTGAIPGTDGKFLIRGLAAGSYKVVVDAATGYTDKTIENVEVSVSKVTDLGTISISN